jgi:phospholipid/cholesterol/gamma-HCH transport system substrate-binding protein
MNKSKRVVVIIFSIFAILVIVFGYLYLSGGYQKIYGNKADVYFYDVSGLKAGSPVYIRGMEKGKVSKVEITEDGKMVRVRITLDKDVKLTEDTKFLIRSSSYLGADRVLVAITGTGPLMSKTTKFYGTNDVTDLESVFGKLNSIVTKLESGEFDKQIKSIKNDLLGRLDTLAKGFQSPMSDITKPFDAIVKTLDTLGKYLKSEGTVKKLVTSEDLYNEIRETNNSLRTLLDDIKANPKKYFTVKIF